ncbi:MAG: S41 family peptidase [Pseudohongiellaceae bacterium]|jgi:carboxyl-terminal processing protease
MTLIAKLIRPRLLAPLTLALAIAAPAASAQVQQPEQAVLPLPIDEVRMFTQAMERIRRAYVEEIDDRTLLENAIRGMLAGLDPHSSYLSGDDYDLLQETTTGEFGGLGIEVGREDGYIKVISPIDDTPADRAGIQAGDFIIAIDSKPVRELLPEEAANMMRGEPGTEVTVTISREGVEPFDLTIVREVISVASVRSMMLEPGYAYIRVAQFRTNTGDELEEELESLYAEHETLKGLVLDLRNNPGGVLQASVKAVDLFIDQGAIVSTRGRMEGNDLAFDATLDTLAPDVPLVVLINNGSASASEIVAGALQDHGRAIVMGTKSFGKGSVQSVLPLDERRALKLTTSRYYTPNGRSIQAQGIEPDITVGDAFVTRRSRNVTEYSEADLQGHLQAESGSEEVNNNEEMREALISAEEVLVTDYPLNEALNVLKGINAFKPRQSASGGSFAQNND